MSLEGEATKAGFLLDKRNGAMSSLEALPYVAVKGSWRFHLLTSDPEQTRPYFRRLRELTLRLSRQSTGTVSLKELSMDMPNEYHVAIEEEATMMRVGTATLGAQHV